MERGSVRSVKWPQHCTHHCTGRARGRYRREGRRGRSLHGQRYRAVHIRFSRRADNTDSLLPQRPPLSGTRATPPASPLVAQHPRWTPRQPRWCQPSTGGRCRLLWLVGCTNAELGCSAARMWIQPESRRQVAGGASQAPSATRSQRLRWSS